ncbi:hypothetical protein [Chroococcidiopsis sp.]
MMVAVLLQLLFLQIMIGAIALLTLYLSQLEPDIQPARRRSHK